MAYSTEYTCRLCLKLTSEENLTPLFENLGYENVGLEWRRMFSFVYNIQGLPDKICNNCKAQAEWVLSFHRQCYENDIVLRLNQQVILDTEAYNSEFFGPDENNLEEHVSDVKKAYDTWDLKETIDYEHEQTLATEDTEMVEQGYLVEDSRNNLIQPENSDKGCSENDELKEELDDIESSYREIPFLKSENQNMDGSGISENKSITRTSGYYCPICGKSFTGKSSMYRHRKNHDNLKSFECTFSGCDKKFSRKLKRDEHVKTIHENRIYKCPICPHIEQYRANFGRHIRKVHSEISGLQPMECSKTE